LKLLDVAYSRILVRKLKAKSPVLMETIPLSSQVSDLARAAEVLGSDKGSVIAGSSKLGWPSHTYTEFYERYFKGREQNVGFVLECGIGTNNPALISTMGTSGSPGASLRLWRDFFPNAEVVGVDIDADILFQEDRIRTFQLDQTNRQATSGLLTRLGFQFDLIVDDGLHTFEAGVAFFESSFPFLRPNGLYVIEDITEQDALRFQSHFMDSHLTVDLVRLRRGNKLTGDNQLICVTHSN
jgi:hypothetical protein